MNSFPRRADRPAAVAQQALFFRVGATELALPAHRVAAVTEVARCTQIPSPDPALLGVARVGERVLPLIDAHRRLRLEPEGVRAFPWTCVVVNGADGEVAVRIDAVVGLRPLPAGALPAGCALAPLDQLIDGDVARQD